MKEWKKKRGGNDEHNDAVVADHVLTVDVAFISHPPTIKQNKISQSNSLLFLIF